MPGARRSFVIHDVLFFVFLFDVFFVQCAVVGSVAH
jgi:hypothetical protein